MLPEDSQELAKSKPHHVPEDPETPTKSAFEARRKNIFGLASSPPLTQLMLTSAQGIPLSVVGRPDEIAETVV
jgi:hypothetical protein